MGVCGDVRSSCSQMAPCQSPDDTCAQTKYICIRHTQCDSRPLCYPLSMADDSEVRVDRTGDYVFTTSSNIADTYGYFYQGNFYPSYPQYNFITQDDDGSGNNQFRIPATLRADITYILVFMTYSQLSTGSFDVFAAGAGDVSFNPLSP